MTRGEIPRPCGAEGPAARDHPDLGGGGAEASSPIPNTKRCTRATISRRTICRTTEYGPFINKFAAETDGVSQDHGRHPLDAEGFVRQHRILLVIAAAYYWASTAIPESTLDDGRSRSHAACPPFLPCCSPSSRSRSACARSRRRAVGGRKRRRRKPKRPGRARSACWRRRALHSASSVVLRLSDRAVPAADRGRAL